jgi:hypothetical protein
VFTTSPAMDDELGHQRDLLSPCQRLVLGQRHRALRKARLYAHGNRRVCAPQFEWEFFEPGLVAGPSAGLSGPRDTHALANKNNKACHSIFSSAWLSYIKFSPPRTARKHQLCGSTNADLVGVVCPRSPRASQSVALASTHAVQAVVSKWAIPLHMTQMRSMPMRMQRTPRCVRLVMASRPSLAIADVGELASAGPRHQQGNHRAVNRRGPEHA